MYEDHTSITSSVIHYMQGGEILRIPLQNV